MNHIVICPKVVTSCLELKQGSSLIVSPTVFLDTDGFWGSPEERSDGSVRESKLENFRIVKV